MDEPTQQGYKPCNTTLKNSISHAIILLNECLINESLKNSKMFFNLPILTEAVLRFWFSIFATRSTPYTRAIRVNFSLFVASLHFAQNSLRCQF